MSKTPIIIMGVFLLGIHSLYSQPKNTTFNLNDIISQNSQFDLFYDDKDLADTYAEELSLIITDKLSQRNVSINYPVEFNTVKTAEINTINDYVSKNSNAIVLHIVSQSSSTRNNIKGVFYYNSKLIGSFSSYRTIWNNNRLILLGEFIAEKISEKTN